MPPNDAAPTLPGRDHRTVIVGTTGSGKSVAGAELLLQYRKRYPNLPWVIFNPKRDRLLDSIGAEQVKLSDNLPKRGLENRMIIYHPVAESDDDNHVNRIIDQAMWLGNTGLYFDEGYSIPTNSKSFRRALTQGRSKNVPIITLSQRPVYLDKFVFTEASYFRVFFLVDTNDRKRVKENTSIQITDALPRFGSYWYDVAQRASWEFKPGPNTREVIDGFKALQPPKRKSWFG